MTVTPKASILVVEDEEDILELVRFNLAREGYRVIGFSSGEEALRTLRNENAPLPDLVILDLMLPGLDGLEVCRHLKNEDRTRHLPLVMLTAKGEEADIVAGLEMGADDYIPKPFSPRVLLARVKAILRRSSRSTTGEEAEIHVGELALHPGRREARVDGAPVELTSTEFNLLWHLARRPGWVSTRQQIIDAVRGADYHITDRAVDVQVAGLRKKLGAAGNRIETVRGVGYRLTG